LAAVFRSAVEVLHPLARTTRLENDPASLAADCDQADRWREAAQNFLFPAC